MLSQRMSEPGTPASRGSAPRRGKAGRLVAATLVTTLTVAGVAFASGQNANAASPPLAQSVGRFLDGEAGTSPIQSLVDLKDARALAPGTQSVQNPLDATLLGKLELPLTHDLQLPQLLGITLGAANQVAVAHNDGSSYGASGAVSNSGGISVGGDNNAFPASATIKLSAATIAGASNTASPAAATVPNLGEVDVTVGAVAALASTPVGVNKGSSTDYGIGHLDINATSPLLAQLLSGLNGPVSKLLTTLATLFSLGETCPLSSGQLPVVDILNGSITLNPVTGGLTISLDKLLNVFGLNINKLPPNTDVIDLLLKYLTDPNGLATGISMAIKGLFDPNVKNTLAYDFVQCAPAQFKVAVTKLFGLTGALETGLTKVLSGLKGTGGKSPLDPIGAALKQLVDIGINVQPNGPAGTFTSKLKATPDQATPVVPGQTVERAIELNLVGDPLATLALANAAAGPSSAAPVTPTSSGPSSPNTNPPTGVNAGQASGGGGSELPLVLLIVGLFLSGGGAVAWRMRGMRAR